MFVNSLLLFCLFSFSVLVVLMLMLMLLMLMLCYTGKYTVSIASFQLHGALRVLHINERTTPMQAHSEALNKFTCTTSKQNTHTHQQSSNPAHTMREDEEKKKLNQKTKRNGRRIQKTKQDGNGWQNIAEERVERTFRVKTKRVQTKLLKNHHIKYLPPPECTDDVVANNNQ